MKGSIICETTCCGCAACMSICPKSAISMAENEKGFLNPVVDETLCVDCGLCQKVCNSKIEKENVSNAYILKIKDSVQHLMSQSGGAFTAVSNAILDDDGMVFGVVADENFEGVYGCAKSREEREAMHGSKYMQARVNYTYREVEKALESHKVLFSGTPCQVGALKKYLKNKKVCTDNLYTVDIVCHGVPSVLIFRGILNEARKKVGKIHQVIWRDKLYSGWGANTSSFYGIDKYSTGHFYKIFWSNLCLRDSCFQCQYASLGRCSDITIGDAWGVKKQDPSFADSRGVSLVLINSAKGVELFEKFKENVVFKSVDINDYIQPNMKGPSKANRSVTEFWNDYFSKDFSFILKKYGENNLLLNYKYVLKKGINAICKRK
ncbi:Coenzyme F420 hydrogenase/dehydrogenase, beta subunit C-terminal domain [Butyrivibrio sp. VCB2006]|uniref:Coenzyme F420 hydrogenase/dehydrogenase, beta subunit C-terminal domain n=1 Tax=Butyrivibrio sp. VCB2006 TaxID=1280679 RepID=UPI0003FCF18E|nr:Coenzyme F420 hydrogenase/dehydrogenase, beta subunit C-terminal domain [Butyrivibrio sp. VCB2006]